MHLLKNSSDIKTHIDPQVALGVKNFHYISIHSIFFSSLCHLNTRPHATMSFVCRVRFNCGPEIHIL